MLETVTSPDERLRCCVLVNGDRCPNPSRYWVGTNGVDDYTYACEAHLEDVKQEGDAVETLPVG